MRALRGPGWAAIAFVFALAVHKPMDAATSDRRDQAMDHIAAAQELVPVKPEEALARSRAALSEIEALPGGAESTRLRAGAVWLEAQALNRLNRLAEARSVIEPAIRQIATEEPGSILHAELLYTKASILQKQGKVQESFSSLQNAFRFFGSALDNNGQAKSLVIMASIYRQAGDYTKSIDYYNQAIDLHEGDKFFQLAIFNNRANSYRDTGLNGKAREDFTKSLRIARELKNPGLICQVLSNLAYSEVNESRFDDAKLHLDEALSIASKSNEKMELSYVQGVYAFFWYKKGDFLRSSEWMDRAFSGVETTKTTPSFKDFHRTASDIYERTGRYSLALKHQKAFKRLDDQARDLMVNTNSALMAAQFDFTNQDLRIARLQAEKLRKDTELAESRNRITLILLGGSVLVGGLLGYNFLSLRRSSRRIDATNTRLNLANESLGRALKAKSEFLATTSHEIRTPLNGILGVTQVLLADDKVSPDVRDRVRLMHGAGETMRALVNDILDAAKIESGTLIINKRETDLGGLLEDAARLWSDRAEEKGLTLTIDYSSAPPKIIEDGSRLRQILFNLLSNAIKFTDTGSVTLTAARETLEAGERLIITVSDTGIGIPPDRIEDIFESFQQVDGGVTRRFGGTGLGLSISRSLAEAMGGSLGVESALGQGSVFTLVLPLVRPQAALQAGEAASGGPAFLIIEANPLTRSLLRAAVAPVGLEVEFAADLDAAVQRLSAGGVEAALVDAAMLGTDEQSRLTALAGLAATGGGRIAVTWPSPDPDVTSRILAAGAAQVISKPISASALGAALCEGRAARA